MHQHKIACNSKWNTCKSSLIIENDDYDIVLVENVSCEAKEQLHPREIFYAENNQCLNKFIPGRTKKEWVEV